MASCRGGAKNTRTIPLEESAAGVEKRRRISINMTCAGAKNCHGISIKFTCAGGISGDGGAADSFDVVPDDILICIFSRLSSAASSPSDLFCAFISCKRFYGFRMNPMVLSKASVKSLGIRAKKWCESAHQFLRRCALAGNLEACYILGMIRFYCLKNRSSGITLMAKAAIGLHTAALYSLSVIQFNGSGGSKTDKDLRAGVALCARAAALGHLDALREIGHCLQDGYGVRQNVLEGRRFLIQANYTEFAGAGAAIAEAAAAERHPANRFMAEWFAERCEALAAEDLRLCSNGGCGRPETRRHEFRRCSVCGAVNYCSRACQALDWKISHKVKCATVERWLHGGVPPPPVAVDPVAGGAPPAEGEALVFPEAPVVGGAPPAEGQTLVVPEAPVVGGAHPAEGPTLMVAEAPVVGGAPPTEGPPLVVAEAPVIGGAPPVEGSPLVVAEAPVAGSATAEGKPLYGS